MYFALYSVASTRRCRAPTRTPCAFRRRAAAGAAEEQVMLQFLIGFSITAAVVTIIVALVYWSERIIFRRRPKAAANHVGTLLFCSEAGWVLAAFLMIAIVVAAVPLL